MYAIGSVWAATINKKVCWWKRINIQQIFFDYLRVVLCSCITGLNVGCPDGSVWVLDVDNEEWAMLEWWDISVE